MAEIKVEKKDNKGSNNNKLIWIVVIFLFGLVALFWWVGTDDEDIEVEEVEAVEQEVSENVLSPNEHPLAFYHGYDIKRSV